MWIATDLAKRIIEVGGDIAIYLRYGECDLLSRTVLPIDVVLSGGGVSIDLRNGAYRIA